MLDFLVNIRIAKTSELLQVLEYVKLLCHALPTGPFFISSMNVYFPIRLLRLLRNVASDRVMVAMNRYSGSESCQEVLGECSRFCHRSTIRENNNRAISTKNYFLASRTYYRHNEFRALIKSINVLL